MLRCSIGSLVLLSLALIANAQTVQVLHSFQGADGAQPLAALKQAKDGSFYGTTFLGGASNLGTVFRMTADGTVTTLVSFNGTNGSNPCSELTLGTDGNFYGTTEQGGAGGAGTAFKMTPAGALTTLLSFGGAALIKAGLVECTNGYFYGTSFRGGGDGGYGFVYAVNTNGGGGELTAFNWANGAYPSASLALGADGNFYGTTTFGGAGDPGTGANGGGTVFKMTPSGALTTLWSFDGSYGADLVGGLLPIGKINGLPTFIGTAEIGTPYGAGAVFEFSAQSLTMLYIFGDFGPIQPAAALVAGSDGNFYGTASSGGLAFQLTPYGAFEALDSDNTNVSTGLVAPLIEASDGDFYGTAPSGGASGDGTIFRIVMSYPLSVTQRGASVVLSWPTNFPGFALQSSIDLSSSDNWSNCSALPAVIGHNFVATNTASADSMFFRLKK